MPTAPRLSTPQVQESIGQALQVNPNVGREAFGGGAATAGVFDAGFKLVEKAKKDADELAVQDAERKLSELETKLLYDPEKGIQNRRGKNAFGLPGEINDEYSSKADEITSELTNDVQKRAFQAKIEGRRNDINKTVGRHVSAEIRTYDDQTTQAYLKNEATSAIMNYQDPEKVLTAINNQKEAYGKYAMRNGLDAEVAKDKIRQIEAKTHKGIVERMLANGDDMYAEKYYQANKEALGDEVTDVEKWVADQSLRGKSQRTSDEISSKHGSMTAALEQVKKIDDPKLRDATLDRVKQNFALKDAAKRDYLEKAQVNAANFIDKNNDLDKYIGENLRDWQSFSMSERKQIESYAAAKKEGRKIETNYQSYYDLRTLAETPATKEKFLETNLMEYRNELSDAHFKAMVDLQAGLRKGDGKAQNKLDGYRTDSQIVADALLSAGINPKKNPEDTAKFRASVDREVFQLTERTGKKASNQEIQEITDNLMLKVVTDKGFFFDTKKRVFQMEEKDMPNIELGDIPKAERQKIQDTLKRRGLIDDDRSIIELYSKKLKSMNVGSR